MELLTLYHAVAGQLDRLDFAALYPGYHRYPFALYDEEQVCLEGQLFPWDDRFLGNPSINFVEAKGAQQPDGSITLDILGGVKAVFRPREGLDLAAWFAERDRKAAAHAAYHSVRCGTK